MSGHMVTMSDQNVEVLGTQFNPDAAPSSANMITDLGPSQNLLTCDLTKAVWWYRPSPGEGSFDSQSLFGRSDWLEQIANPSPLGSQNDSRAKWVGKTGFYRSRHTTACVELSSAVHSKTSEVGVGDAPTDRSDLRRLNPLNESSPAMTLSGMRRPIDSDRSPAFPLLVPYPCSCTRGRSVGAFSSVRRAGRLRIANGHARHRISGFTKPSAPMNNVAVCERSTTDGTLLGPGTRPVSNHKVLRLCQTGSLFSPRLGRKQGLPPRGVHDNKQGDPWVPGTNQGPMGFPGKGDAMIQRPYLFAGPAGTDWRTRVGHVRSTRCCGSARRGIATRPVRPAPTGNSSMGVPWQQQGPAWVPGQRRRDDPQAVFGRLWGTRRPRQCPSIEQEKK
jgi:hypothetical protein